MLTSHASPNSGLPPTLLPPAPPPSPGHHPPAPPFHRRRRGDSARSLLEKSDAPRAALRLERTAHAWALLLLLPARRPPPLGSERTAGARTPAHPRRPPPPPPPPPGTPPPPQQPSAYPTPCTAGPSINRPSPQRHRADTRQLRSRTLSRGALRHTCGSLGRATATQALRSQIHQPDCARAGGAPGAVTPSHPPDASGPSDRPRRRASDAAPTPREHVTRHQRAPLQGTAFGTRARVPIGASAEPTAHATSRTPPTTRRRL
jgi:hypothetical protein